MRKSAAALGSSLFLALAPGTMAVLLPWSLTRWRAGDWWLPVRLSGLIPLAAGTAVLLSAFVRFAAEGLGTPAPVAPTEHLDAATSRLGTDSPLSGDGSPSLCPRHNALHRRSPATTLNGPCPQTPPEGGPPTD